MCASGRRCRRSTRSLCDRRRCRGCSRANRTAAPRRAAPAADEVAGLVELQHRRRRVAAFADARTAFASRTASSVRSRPLPASLAAMNDPHVIVGRDADADGHAHDPVVGHRLRPERIDFEPRGLLRLRRRCCPIMACPAPRASRIATNAAPAYSLRFFVTRSILAPLLPGAMSGAEVPLAGASILGTDKRVERANHQQTIEPIGRGRGCSLVVLAPGVAAHEVPNEVTVSASSGREGPDPDGAAPGAAQVDARHRGANAERTAFSTSPASIRR